MHASLERLDWLVEALASFARAKGLSRAEAFQLARENGSFDFIIRHYEVEHQLSFDEVVEDMDTVFTQHGGTL